MTRVPLASIADIIRGRRVDYDDLVDTGVRFLNAKALAEDDATPQYLPDAAAAGTELREGDIALAVSFRPGASRLIDHGLRGAVVGHDCVVLRIREEGGIAPGWLGIWTRSSDFRTQVAARTSTAGIPRIAARDVAELQVPVATSEEQVRVESAVAELDRTYRDLHTLTGDVQALRDLEIDLAVFGVAAHDSMPSHEQPRVRTGPRRTTAAGRRRK